MMRHCHYSGEPHRSGAGGLTPKEALGRLVPTSRIPSSRRQRAHEGEKLLGKNPCKRMSKLQREKELALTCKMLRHLSISQGCCNILSPTGWLKTMEMYSLTVLEAGSEVSVSLGPSQGVSRVTLPSEALGGDLPHLFQLLAAAGVLWLVAASP